MSSLPEFPCERCGACCRNVDKAEETRFLDRGDGSCIHYNDQLKLCSIYESRPAICRVEHQFVIRYHHFMDWPEFIRLNTAACKSLQTLEKLGPLKPEA